MSLYVNGELVGRRSSAYESATNSGRVLSGVDLRTHTHFADLIDEIKVYRRALSAADVRRAFLAAE
jgi:hypothetical protein